MVCLCVYYIVMSHFHVVASTSCTSAVEMTVLWQLYCPLCHRHLMSTLSCEAPTSSSLQFVVYCLKDCYDKHESCQEPVGFQNREHITPISCCIHTIYKLSPQSLIFLSQSLIQYNKTLCFYVCAIRKRPLHVGRPEFKNSYHIILYCYKIQNK